MTTPIIELIIQDGSPLPPEATQRAVRDAALILGAVSGVEFEIRDSASGRLTATACRVEWRRWLEVSGGHTGMAWHSPCRIMIAHGGLGVSNEDQARCVILHELWHLLLPPHWHSHAPGSVMNPERNNECRVTSDLVTATEAAKNWQSPRPVLP